MHLERAAGRRRVDAAQRSRPRRGVDAVVANAPTPRRGRVAQVGVAEYVCEVMNSDACAATWALNGYADISECVAAYETLPDVDAMGFFDGKSKGCRVVHSFMADTNAKHCPHIS